MPLQSCRPISSVVRCPIPPPFAPNDRLAGRLLEALPTGDGSHDLSHILRVWANVRRISEEEGGDLTVLTAATILHDDVPVPKGSPSRASASTLAAAAAAEVLGGLGWAEDAIDTVRHAIESHSFSANIKPLTLEAKILQDADRLDAIGHIGIARCFYVAGRMGSALYDPADPTATGRPLDDARFALDRFRTKLLRLSASFQTETGRELAAARHRAVEVFFEGLTDEIEAPSGLG